MLLMVAISSSRASEQPVVTLESAITIALQNNPDLAQMQARAQALMAIPSQVGSLPDPVVSFNTLNLPVDTFDTRQENMTQIQLGISQTIPFPGKLALREQAASFEAAAALQSVTEARWWLQKKVRNTWWQIFYLDHALQIVDSNLTLLRQFIQIARTKYEVGEGLQQDVLLAQLELSKLLDQQLKLNGLRRNTVAQLNTLLDRPSNLPVALPNRLAEKLPKLIAETVLYQMAEEFRALLAAKRETINAAQSRLDLAKKDYFPDLNVGAAYGIRDRMLDGAERADFLSMKLSMTVPIFIASKQAKAVDQRTSELMRQKYALRDEWNHVRGQISQGVSDYQRAKDQVILFKTGIIPQARQTVASMLAGYQVNKLDFLNLVQSQITLFNYEMQYWNAFAEANQSLAQLTAAVGKEEIYE
ncbi:TolC family protein [Methylomarinum sp. Ch1-1]|uniref:TolC family protein n=1 Tax=Methylomarinum roseum TaxID=3067653 RepID=A0AAU7NYF5_9GAMM|nr:TolC family protein [Methylomarinum sp. Ch1-1]MDP4521890.1 TolC family protein [Methylomarinum sp. Ch1-1]